MSMLSRFMSLNRTPIRYVGGTTAQITGSISTTTSISLTALTGGMDTQPREGDVVIVYYGTGAGEDRAIGVTTAGYTEIAELYSNDNEDVNLSVSYKAMSSTPDTSVVVSATGHSSDSGSVVIKVFRNVDIGTILDATSTTATGLNSVLCNPPAITPVTAGAVIVSGGSGAHTQGVQTFSSSDLVNFSSVGGPDNLHDSTTGMGFYNWISGAVDPAAFTFSTTNSVNFSWAAVTLALRPAIGRGPIFIANSAVAESGANKTSLTINKPTGTADNDLMVSFIYTNGLAGGITPPAGWTEVLDSRMSGDSANVQICYKTASSEGSSYNFTTGTATDITGFIITYRNGAYDTVGSTLPTTTTASSITVGNDYSKVLYFAADDNTTLVDNGTIGIQRILFPQGNNSVACYEFNFNAGATGTITAVQDTSSAKDTAVLLSIKPS